MQISGWAPNEMDETRGGMGPRSPHLQPLPWGILSFLLFSSYYFCTVRLRSVCSSEESREEEAGSVPAVWPPEAGGGGAGWGSPAERRLLPGPGREGGLGGFLEEVELHSSHALSMNF